MTFMATPTPNTPTTPQSPVQSVSRCRFARLREHTPAECPTCNPAGWMAGDAPVEHNDA